MPRKSLKSDKKSSTSREDQRIVMWVVLDMETNHARAAGGRRKNWRWKITIGIIWGRKKTKI